MLEFHYSIELTIVHKTMDSKEITKILSELSPSIETTAGSDKLDQNGVPTGRKAKLSVWSAPLHSSKKINSDDIPLSEFLQKLTCRLLPHRNLFSHLSVDGDVFFSIVLWGKTHCSATMIEAQTVKKCAELNLGVELYFYGPGQDGPTQGQ